MKNIKVAIFTGTRAEYGLLYWLLNDVKRDKELTLQLLVSGSHLSPEFGLTFKQILDDGFEIAEKIEMLLSSDSPTGTAKSMGLAVLGYADAFSRLNPDVIVILGDRYEAFAAAQTAMVMRIPIIHLHGGEVSEGAYDDAIRHAITKLSYLHATSTDIHRQRVIQLGESPARVVNVGAIGLDHLKRTTLMPRNELARALEFDLSRPYFIVTYHPVTLADEPPADTFELILRALDHFPKHQIVITYPNADDGGHQIISLLKSYGSDRLGRVLTIPSLGQIRYLSAVKYADALIGKSSSGIIEVPSFDVPTVNIGLRQKGRLAAKSVLHCAATYDEILKTIELATSRKYKQKNEEVVNPYGMGDASSRIIDMIKKCKFSAMKTFHDLDV